jgi:hypothetical protein
VGLSGIYPAAVRRTFHLLFPGLEKNKVVQPPQTSAAAQLLTAVTFFYFSWSLNLKLVPGRLCSFLGNLNHLTDIITKTGLKKTEQQTLEGKPPLWFKSLHRQHCFIFKLSLRYVSGCFFSIACRSGLLAVMIGEKLWYLSAASSTILFPEIASSEEYDSSLTLKSSRFNFTIIMIAAILLGLFSHFLIRILYSTVYLPAATAMIFLLPGIVAMVIPKLLAADLTGRGKPQYAMITSIISFVLNFLLNVLLIPAYGIVGAAIASSISYIITAIIFIWIYHRETSTNLRDFFILKKTDLPRLRGLQ